MGKRSGRFSVNLNIQNLLHLLHFGLAYIRGGETFTSPPRSRTAIPKVPLCRLLQLLNHPTTSPDLPNSHPKIGAHILETSLGLPSQLGRGFVR